MAWCKTRPTHKIYFERYKLIVVKQQLAKQAVPGYKMQTFVIQKPAVIVYLFS